MAICGNFMKGQGKLKKDTIVATVMSNLGFYIMGEEKGLNIEKTKVGDRYVLEHMKKIGANLGGISELIANEKTGLIFEDVEDLANCINKLLDMDDSNYRRISNNCIIESEKYSPKVIYHEILNVYSNLLKEGS